MAYGSPSSHTLTLFFFFSRRRRHTRCLSDWSSDVCSSDLLTLSGGGPDIKDSAGNPWASTFINANGDPAVDLRSNLAAESRAKVVYEYLKQFTDDPSVQDSLTFLMTREVAHYQQFTAALNELPVNFPPGKLPGDP